MCETLLKSICRLCLKDDFSLRCIFTCRSPSLEPVSDVLEQIYDLKICEGDGLPSNICVPCFSKVLEFDMYRKNVGHAEEELRKLLFRTCNKSKEVTDEVTDSVTELTAEREMVSAGIDLKHNDAENDVHTAELEELQNVAKDSMEGIENDTNVPIKNEIDIDEWVMPQDMLPEKDILERVKSEAGEEVLEDTEVSNKDFIEIEEQPQDEIRPEKDTSKVSAAIDIEQNYAENDGLTEELEELQSSESCDINSSECLEQMYENLENVSTINNISVVSKSGISGENKANKEMCEEIVKTGSFAEKESLFSLKSKSGDNSAKSGSSSSGMAVQSRKKSFFCYICKKSFVKKWNLSQHIRIHNDDRPFKCKECGQAFKRESAKIMHELRHLKKQNENVCDKKRSTKKSFVCEICKKEFSSVQTLHKHSNWHKNQYLCTFCGKGFGCKNHLNRHLMIHTNKKPFSCEVCKKTFNRKEHLKRHLVTHSDNRSFQCNVCDKKFKTKQLKNYHELLHLRKK